MLALTAVAAAAANIRVDVSHDHLRKEGTGTLAVTDAALTFEETGKKANRHRWSVPWQEIQQLWISPKTIRILTYKDVWWKGGADREYELHAVGESTFVPLVSSAQTKLGPRLVAAVAEPAADPVLWQVPVKLREKFGGPEGVLRVSTNRIVFDSPEKGKSRTWTHDDIDNVATAGPYDFTLTTFERSKGSYGDRRGFHFQLKEKLNNRHYQQLWRTLHQAKQLEFLTSIQENPQ